MIQYLIVCIFISLQCLDQTQSIKNINDPQAIPNSATIHARRSLLLSLQSIFIPIVAAKAYQPLKQTYSSCTSSILSESNDYTLYSSNNFVNQGQIGLSKSLTLPLYNFDGVLTVRYRINGKLMQSIVDSGSPFLVIPTICTKDWGCLDQVTLSTHLCNTALEDTTEIYGGQEYDTEWKIISGIEFSNSAVVKNVIVATVGTDVLLPPGGVFFGLIKNITSRIRPSFLSQTTFSSFEINLKSMKLVLSETPLIPKGRDAIPLVDLRPMGDPVSHYAAKIKELYVNSVRIDGKYTIYGVFDTGTSGCIFQDDIYNDQNTPIPPRNIVVVFETESGAEYIMQAYASRDNLLVVTASKIEWFRSQRPSIIESSLEYINSIDPTSSMFDLSTQYNPPPRVIVLGLAFLKPDRVMTVDINDNRMIIDT